MAERSVDTAFARARRERTNENFRPHQSGVALRLPPRSMTFGCGLAAVHLCVTSPNSPLGFGATTPTSHGRACGAKAFMADPATRRDRTGPIKSTISSRAVCMDMTNGKSTLLEAAMMAAESTPPGLVAR